MKNAILFIVLLLVAFFMLLPEPNPTPSDSDNAKPELISQNFIVRNVQLYDGNQRFERVDVAITNNRIVEIAPSLPKQSVVAEIDGDGKTLLPGFVDAHTHAYQNALSEALNFGVTTELDMFTMPEFAQPHTQQRESESNVQAADLFSATILATAPGGHGTEYGFEIPVLTSPKQAEKFVQDRIAQGADYIKAVYNSEHAQRQHSPSISNAILHALILSAHQHDRMLVVHVDNLVSASEAIHLGADGIIHSFLDKTVDEKFIALMREKQAFMIPTLAVESSVVQQSSGPALLDNPVNTPYLTKQQRQQLRANFPDFGIPAPALQRAFESVKRLTDAGVPILAGSDAPNPGTTHGLSLHAELILLTQAGLSNEQAIHSATGAAAKQFPIGERGTLIKGGLASMVLIDGNPFKNIADTQRIARIWKNGTEFNRIRYVDEVSSNPVFELGSITDFNHDIASVRMGKGLVETTDQFAGGVSVVNLALQSNPQASDSASVNRYLQVSGELKSGFMFPWSGFAFMLADQPQQGADISQVTALSFRAKGTMKTDKLSVLWFESGSYMPLQKDINLTDQWQDYRIEVAQLAGIDISDIANISFVRSQTIGPFSFMIDDIRFE